MYRAAVLILWCSVSIRALNPQPDRQLPLCSGSTETQGHQVSCKQISDNQFTCTRVIEHKINDAGSVTIILSSTYHSSLSLQENNTVCVQEMDNVLKVLLGNSSSNPDDFWLDNMVEISAMINSYVKQWSKEAVGLLSMGEDCDQQWSDGSDCIAVYRPNSIVDDLHESIFLLRMEGSFPGLDDDDAEDVTEEPKLAVLNLSGKNLTKLPNYVQELSDLLELDVSNNPLLSKENLSLVLEQLTSLQRLDLSGVIVQRLESLSAGLMALKLRSLKMSHCQITSLASKIAKDIFDSQSTLQHLDLSYNPIIYIRDDLFSELGALKILDLSHAYLNTSVRLSIANNALVDFIDLSNNLLTDVKVIETCGNVRKLNLYGNAISEWSDGSAFISPCKSPWLMFLNVSNNNIQTIPACMRESLDALRVVDLGRNPIRCDCEMIGLSKWIKESKVMITCIDMTCTPQERDWLSNCSIPSYSGLWYLAIPFGFILIVCIVVKIILWRRRFQLAYIKYLYETKKENRKKAERLQKTIFEYDVLVIHSEDDSVWVNEVLVPRLEDYRVVLGSPSDPFHKQGKHLHDAIQNSRHILFVVSNSFKNSDYCMHIALTGVNIRILEGEEHNLVFVMLPGAQYLHYPYNFQYLCDTYDCIMWPEDSKSDKKANKKLLSCLGTSTNKTWESNYTNEVITVED